jgi:hypothetical protein
VRHQGRIAWDLWLNGERLSEVSEPTGTPEASETPSVSETPKEEASKTAEAKTFDQDQVNRMIGKEKAKAEAEARKAFLESYGVSSEKELKAVLDSHKAAEEAKKTELDKANEALEALKSATAAEKAQLLQDLHTDRVKLALSRVNPALPEDEEKADAALNRLVGMVNVPAGSTVDEITASVKELKEEFPALFAHAPQKREGNPPSNPAGAPRKASLGAKSPQDTGRDYAAEANAKRGVKLPTA